MRLEMLNEEVRKFLAAFLDLPQSRIDVFAQRLNGLKDAQFPETGLILDIIHQLATLPPHVQEDILVLKRGSNGDNQYRPRPSRHWA